MMKAALRPIHLILLAAVIAFGAGLNAQFHLDDYALFADPAITSPSGWWEVWKPLQTRPLTYFTYWLNYQAGGRDPWGYHVVNLGLHLLAVWLLYGTLTASRLVSTLAAEAGAMLFALHPAMAEPVNYIFARGTLLATVFCLLALRDWLSERPWRAVLWFALALLAKEECVLLPIALLILRRTWKPALAMLALSAAAGVRLLVATTVIQGSGAGAQSGIAPLDYFGTQGFVILRYLRLLVFPYGFTIDPDIRVAHAWWAWAVLAAAVLLSWRRTKWFVVGLVLLAPSSTFLPAADLAADRRLYLPMVAFAALGGVLLARLDRRILAAGGLLLLALSLGRTLVWRNERALWQEAMERSPGKLRPYLQFARASEPAVALRVLEQAKSIAPGDPRIASEKGMRYFDLGQPALALAEFGRALALAPNDPQALNNRGVALLALGQKEAAIEDFRSALRANACLPDARSNLERLGVAVPAACGGR